MGKPDESLDDNVIKRPPESSSEFPHDVSPRLADPEALEDRELSEPVANTFLIWVYRFVAVGSVLAMTAIVLLGGLSAILFVIGEPTTERNLTTNGRPAEEPEATTNIEHADEPVATTNGQYADEAELTTNGQPPEEQTQTKEPLSIFSASKSARVNITRSNARRRRARPRIRVAGYEAKRSLRWHPKPLESLFTPTTLVIYVENGVIKTRIEPWVRSTPTQLNN